MTKLGRFTIKNSPSASNRIIANNELRRKTRKLPTWLERVFGYDTPQSEEVRNKW